MSGSGFRIRMPLLTALVVAAIVACGGEDGNLTDPGDPPGPPDPPDPPDPPAVLECQREGYPCSLAEVDVAVLERSEALADEAWIMVEGGASMPEVATWLAEQPDVVEARSDVSVLRFRVEGGRGTWMIDDAVFGVSVEGGSSPVSLGGRSPSDAATAPPGPPDRTRGAASDIVGPQVDEKRARVISPFLWEHKEYDSGLHTQEILGGTRGYEGRVEFVANEDSTDATVDVSSFEDWDEYQVIHVSTHGARLCDDGVCRTVLAVGKLDVLLPAGTPSRAERIQELEQRGLDVLEGPTTGRDYILATADFFLDEYEGGLEDTLIYLGACESYGPEGTDLVDALQGATSVVIGWDEPAFDNEGAAAARAFYEDLSERGYPTRTAFENLGDLAHGLAIGAKYDAPTLRMSERPDGDDLRIREVVTVLHPAGGSELTSNDVVGAVGVANDGEPDAAPFRVLVEGVPEEDAGDMTVHVTIDDVAHEPIPLVDGTKNEDDAWVVHGTVQLPYDVTEDRNVAWDARAMLHDGGESTHVRTATLSGAEPIMGTTWELTARYTSYYTEDYYTSPTTPEHASATLYLTFEPGQDPLDPYPRYVLTAGEASWDPNRQFGDCTHSAPAASWDVMTEGYSVGSGFDFDTSTDPVGVSGRVYAQTPWVTLTVACDDDTTQREVRPTFNWFVTYANHPPVTVSENGTLVRDTYCLVQDFPNGSYFVQQTDYVMRRLVPGDTSEPPPLHEGECL